MMIIDAPVRGLDKWGSGEFGAPRGKRKHAGIDIACYAGSTVFAVKAGRVTRLGYPYNPQDPRKGHMRYVQITDSDGLSARYFYVSPLVSKSMMVEAGQAIGKTQGLLTVYPGITDHFHFEVKDGNGIAIDPAEYLP